MRAYSECSVWTLEH
uniref:Uncharacterized protein n=1 Tax=Nymphaea colorata TaxID=210225 RepID=A0A5K1CAN0_9MAGN